MASVDRDKVVQYVRMHGPLLPVQLTKLVNTNVLFASAILSELVDSKLLKLSSLKVGGSPLYFAPGQESRLQTFADKLNEKDRHTYEVLRQKLVLRDRALDTLTRYSLRQLKDFAVPLEVRTPSGTEMFWRWFLITTEAATEHIKQIIGAEHPEVPVRAQQSVPQQPQQVAQPVQQQFFSQQYVQPQAPATVHHAHHEVQKPITQYSGQKLAQQQSVEPIKEAVKERVQKPQRKTPAKKKVKETISEPKSEVSHPVAAPLDVNDRMFQKVKAYLDANRIIMREAVIKRKDSDVECIIEIPSSVGNLAFYCRAKDKKKVSDGDLSSLFMEAQHRKMPILYLVTGELSKKARQLLETEFRTMQVKSL